MEKPLRITINDSPFESNRDNTTLYTFRDDAFYDHVFLRVDEDKGDVTGAYVFENGQEKFYRKLEQHIITWNYPQILNGLVQQCDVDAWNKKYARDTIPENWLDGPQ